MTTALDYCKKICSFDGWFFCCLIAIGPTPIGGGVTNSRPPNEGATYKFTDTKSFMTLHSTLSHLFAAQQARALEVATDDHDSVILDPLHAIATIESPCQRSASRDPAIVVLDPADWARQQARLSDVFSATAEPKISTVYLQGGLYHLDEPLILTAKASGATLAACPGESPVIEGSADQPLIILRQTQHVSIRGLLFISRASVHLALEDAKDSVLEKNTFLNAGVAISLDHSERNIIQSNMVLHSSATGIEIKDNSNDNVVIDNVIDGASASETNGGGIFLHAASNNRLSHNLIQNTAGFGIGILNWDDATINTGNIVEYNLLKNTALTASDSGAIYVLGRSRADTGVIIAGNVIDGFGLRGEHVVGIYLDDSTGGATVIRNVIRQGGSDAVQIHGGSNNLVQNNILDLGNARMSAVLFQAAPADTNPTNLQINNNVTHNIIISTSSNPKQFEYYDGGEPYISTNYYASSGGLLPLLGGKVYDRNAIIADPALAVNAPLDGYTAIQAAGTVAHFKPFDVSLAGPHKAGH